MKMTNRIGKVHKTYVLIGGGMGVLSGIAVAVTVGSPLPVLRLWGADVLLPPLWILGILWLAGYARLGGAAGYAWGCPGGGLHREMPLWRGLTFLVVEVTFSCAWYSLSFGSHLLLPGWLCLVASVAAGGLCLAAWWWSFRGAAILCGGGTLWLLYVTLCHLFVILHN